MIFARRWVLSLSLVQAALVAVSCTPPPPAPQDEGTTTDDDPEPMSTSGGTSSGAVDSTTGGVDSTTGEATSSGAVDSTTGSSETTGGEPPGFPALALGFSQIKRFDFTWDAVAGAEHYRLLESPAFGEPFVQLGADIMGESISVTMPLHLRLEASYMLEACNGWGCTSSGPVSVTGSLAEAVGYFKASNAAAGDNVGRSVALSGDGNTLAIGAHLEDSGATGIDGDQTDGSMPDSGAVYVFVRDAADQWSQQAYVKASNTGAFDHFGDRVVLSHDGSTLAVTATDEESNATGIDGDQTDDSTVQAGAVYVFVRDAADQWSQQAYVKASNTDFNDFFGISLGLSNDGDTLAIGAHAEDGGAAGVNGDQDDDSIPESGAVYVFVRDAMDQWSQQAYIKASNPGAVDYFGFNLGLSSDGDTLAVGAARESSNATGIDGDQANDAAFLAGAAYVFVRDAMGQWSQQAYLKASNAEAGDLFGWEIALCGDGDTLAVGAIWEPSYATGIGGSQADDSLAEAGAVYVFVRGAMDQWSQQAYVKASNTGAGDRFGSSLALSHDGDVLAVGAFREASNATGIGGDQADDSTIVAGAVYVLVRDAMDEWSQSAYVKAPNTGANDGFGEATALSGDGNTLATGARSEDGDAIGIGGDQANDAAPNSGAVYLY